MDQSIPSCPAFVIVDSFQSTLAGLVSPKSHWQLCGASLLELTLGWLDRSNVDAAYIWCCSQDVRRQVPDLIKRANCSFRTQVIEPEQVMDVDDDDDFDDGPAQTPFTSTAATSFSKSSASLGDCMRYADSADLLAKYAAQAANEGGSNKSSSASRSALPDFLLVGGTTFAQQPLSSSLKRHRQWREKDRSCVLTIVCSASSVQPPESGLCLLTDANGRLVHWRDSASGDGQDLTIPSHLVAPKSPIGGELHVWPRIFPVAAVCAPEVLVQFADNFDYETLQDVIRGLLTNEEVLGQRIYIDVIDSGLKNKGTFHNTVFHVSDLASFANTMRDLLLSATLSRSLFSLSHLKAPAYYHRFPAAYVSSDASTGLSIIEGVTFVSEGASFALKGNPSSISSTFIGPHCKIGANCCLQESYLAEKCTLSDNVTILFSLLAENVFVGSNSVIEKGCIIGPGVTLGEGARIPSGIFVFLQSPDAAVIAQEFFRGTTLRLIAAPDDMMGLGASPCYILCIEDLPKNIQHYLYWPGLLRYVKPKHLLDKFGRSRTVSGMEQLSLRSQSDKDGDASSEAENRHLSLDSEHIIKRRDIELDEAIERTIREKLGIDNAILEVNSIKHAYGVGIRDLTTSVFRSIFSVPLRGSVPITNANILTHLNAVLANPHVLPLARHYCRSAEAKADCLQAVENVAATSTPFLVNVSGLLQQLYSNYDLLDDEAVKKWFATVQPTAPVYKYAKPFVDWLEAAEEESDEEEDDEDD